MFSSDLSQYSLEQRLSFFQVRRIKPFGKPAIDFCQYLLGFFFLALALPADSSSSLPATPMISHPGGGQYR